MILHQPFFFLENIELILLKKGGGGESDTFWNQN